MKSVTDASFAQDVARGSIIIKCTADWCGPCKTIQPTLDEVAKRFPSIKWFSLDVDKNPRIVRTYDVMSVPMLLFFRDGQYKGMLIHKLTEIRISEAIQQLIL